MNLNKIFVLGNLTRDPEKRALPSGDPVVSFGIATNRYFTVQGEKREEAEFHNIVIFGKLAETAHQYLKKGSLVLIEGRVKTRNWQDTAGVKHYKTEIIAERMQLGPRRDNQASPAPSPAPSQSFQSQPLTQPQTQGKPIIKEEEIPVIQEDTPMSDNKNEKPAQAEKAPPTPEPNQEQAPDEIDVKNIPF